MDFRLDRFATLYLASPFLRLKGESERSVPILMYHSIADEDESQVHPYFRTTTSPAIFTAQMKFLHDWGYETCTLAQAVKDIHGEPKRSREAVVITFDDGFRDFYSHAFPILQDFGLTATMFLPTSYIGETPASFKGKACLTWTEIRELSRLGISFGSHTVTHPKLSSLGETSLSQEITLSKRVIEDRLGESVASFSYPYAFPEESSSFVQRLRDLLVDSRYDHGVTTMIGRARRRDDRYFLRRLPVNSCDDGILFRAKLRGDYDWLHKVQYATKRARMSRNR